MTQGQRFAMPGRWRMRDVLPARATMYIGRHRHPEPWLSAGTKDSRRGGGSLSGLAAVQGLAGESAKKHIL
jgi:hypothetical protein